MLGIVRGGLRAKGRNDWKGGRVGKETVYVGREVDG